jgi:integrase
MSSIYRRRYKAKNPRTGKTETRTTAKYYGKFRDPSGQVQRVPLATDKDASRSMLLELVKKSERVAAGITPALTDPMLVNAKRPLTEHIADFEKRPGKKGPVTGKHAKMSAQRVRAIVAGCEFEVIADINVEKVSKWLEVQRATKKRFGIATSNHHMRAMATFCYWMADPKRGNRCPKAMNPYGNAPCLNEETDVRRQRRALCDEEIAWLLDSTENGPVIGEISGRDRAMLYRMALSTGLRASELRSLEPESFNFSGDYATVTVEACYAKNRRKAVLPLHADMAQRVQAWLAERAGGRPDVPAILSLKGAPAGHVGRLWTGAAVKPHSTADTLRRDLEAARKRWIEASADEPERKARETSDLLKYQTREGYADFHSLRHGFITRVFDSGVKPHHAQKLARHANLRQTMKYSHVEAEQVAMAQQQVRPLPQAVVPNKSVAVG